MAKALVHRSKVLSAKLNGLLKSKNWKSIFAPSLLVFLACFIKQFFREISARDFCAAFSIIVEQKD